MTEGQLRTRGLWNHFSEECQRSGLTLSELCESKAPPAPAARRRIYRWLRDEKGYSIARIGRLFGKSHSAVHYALQPKSETGGQRDRA